LIGPLSVPDDPKLEFGESPAEGGKGMRCSVTGEGGLVLRGWYQGRLPRKPDAIRLCLVVHWDGEEAARAHPVVAALLSKGLHVVTGAMRGTGSTLPKSGAIAGAPDHTPAEHGVWIGRPLLGQWVCDTQTWLRALPRTGDRPEAIVGIGPAGLVALLASALSQKRPSSIVAIDSMPSFVTDSPYASGTPMGLLAPGILKVGDIPHLAGLVAPRRLVIAGGVSPQGKKLSQKELEDAFRFTTGVYKAVKAPEKLTIVAEPDWKKIDL
jgi:hypothetical protein